MKKKREIKRYATVWQSVLLLLTCFAVSCYSGPGGNLHPQKSEGYSVVKTIDDREAAQIMFGETIVQIEGSWNQSIINSVFEVMNNSTAPFSIDFKQVKIEIQREAVKTSIDSIWDVTSEDSNKAKQIYKDYYSYEEGKTKYFGEMKISCPPKQKCSFLVNVLSLKLDKTKSIKVTLPALSGRTQETEIFFNCGADSVFDSLIAQME